MTQRLAQVAIDNWAHFDGIAVSMGMPDLRELPLDRFANFIWYTLTKDKDEKGVKQLEMKVWRPPRGVEIDKRSPWSAENETAAFNAIKAQLSPKK